MKKIHGGIQVADSDSGSDSEWDNGCANHIQVDGCGGFDFVCVVPDAMGGHSLAVPLRSQLVETDCGLEGVKDLEDSFPSLLLFCGAEMSGCSNLQFPSYRQPPCSGAR